MTNQSTALEKIFLGNDISYRFFRVVEVQNCIDLVLAVDGVKSEVKIYLLVERYFVIQSVLTSLQ